jgi:hypothetical protein
VHSRRLAARGGMNTTIPPFPAADCREMRPHVLN